MLAIEKIRADLKEIRYYYSRKEIFDEAFKQVGINSVREKARKYNEAMQTASPQLYDVYFNLYVKNYTQEALANILNYTPEYIRLLNKKLLQFLQKRVKE